MKWFILADIHANLPALEVVLADIEKRCHGIISARDRSRGKIASLGDQIGYNPYPNEVIDIIWNIADVIVIGNHELGVCEYLTHGALRGEFNNEAQWSIAWTADILSNTNREKVIDLVHRREYVVITDRICFTHSGPDKPEKMQYVDSLYQAHKCYLWKKDRTRICFIGHTHDPKIFVVTTPKGRSLVQNEHSIVTLTTGPWEIQPYEIPIARKSGKQRFNLAHADKSLIVVPSVGQPRDRYTCTGYCIYDTKSHTLDYVRIPYTIEQVQSRMKELGFPHALVERLSCGE
jgi:predicted phosphodiesterase